MGGAQDEASFDDLLSAASETTSANVSHAREARMEKTRPLVPGIDAFLGHGYDVFGEFASPNSVKAKIYDLSSEPRVDQRTLDKSLSLDAEQQSHAFVTPPDELTLTYSRPQRVGYMDVFQASFDVRQVDTSDKSANSWGLGATIDGSYQGFSGEIKTRFDTKATRLATTKCLQAIFEMVYWKLDLDSYTYTNPPPIPDDIKRDFAERDVDDLMAKYGTHCLENIGIGTKIVHSYTIETSKFTKSFDVTAAVKAGYKGGDVSVGASTEGEYHDAAWTDRSAVSVRVTTYGTSDSQLGEITDLREGLGEHPMAVLQQGWHNPTLIKFYPDTLKPLWKVEGLMSADKAAEFAARFRERVRTAQGSLAMLFQGLQPLYLLSIGGDKKRYRFANSAHYKDANGEWNLENDGRPWLYALAEPKDGTVPLHELALNDDDSVVRYETETWIALLNAATPPNWKEATDRDYRWSKTNRTLGYVYDAASPETPPPDAAEPVFAFYSRDLQPYDGLFYSRFQEVVWDGGRWKSRSEWDLIAAELKREGQEKIDAAWRHLTALQQLGRKKGYFALMSPEHREGPVHAAGVPHWFAPLPA